MALLTLRNLHLSYGDPPLIDGIDLAVEAGERICLLGRNGEGKSTLLRLIAGELHADDGERVVAQGVRIARLTQEIPEQLHGSVFEVVADGAGEVAGLIKQYHLASHALGEAADAAALDRLEHIQQQLEAVDGWRMEQQVERLISRMQLAPDDTFDALSGGMKRRVLLARALAADPQLLLLDEPTNHLDVESITWLEEFLLDWPGTLLFITHDRGFLQRLATRIVELDRGRLSDFPGDYQNYLRRRAEMDNAEAQANARFDKLLAQEEVWVRQGIKARRTRNEGRVRRLESMRREYGERRGRAGNAKIAMNAAERSGRLVCEAVDVSYAWDGRPIIRDFSTTIMRGDRIGIIGPNGCGKSTLLNLLLGRLQPDSGRIELGTRLEVAYFDQLRDQLELDKTVLDNVAGGSDKVSVNGKDKHVISYLQDFLFPPRRCRQPVRALSGGERNRLLLAKLFTKPANVLVMDEPTNDLDLETLELLEELLLDFDGTLLLVSHDRAFLDNVVTSTLVFEGEGRVNAYVGGYQDWLRQRPALQPVAKPKAAEKPPAAKPAVDTARPKKLSYKDQRELDQLPARIEALEAELGEVQGALGNPELYREAPERVGELNARMQRIEQALAEAYARWEALDG
ncbi:MAG: ATP-binding cassette domain-containing protein [Chromatiaceae bacterium]|nr:ATP-binding cassette domain-containing protein [Chromatiaceae bacterium]MCP5314074.1 ATP-binding cassette domain-containing protein [Chromatiaceae bacterium]